jgi:hypothetical protein
VLRYYGGSFIKALQALYPELDLKSENFFHRLIYSDTQRRRKLLDDIAAAKNFNPLDAKKWYSIKKKDFKQIVGFISSVVG